MHSGGELVAVWLGVEIENDGSPHAAEIHVGGISDVPGQLFERCVPVEVVLAGIGDFNLQRLLPYANRPALSAASR